MLAQKNRSYIIHHKPNSQELIKIITSFIIIIEAQIITQLMDKAYKEPFSVGNDWMAKILEEVWEWGFVQLLLCSFFHC